MGSKVLKKPTLFTTSAARALKLGFIRAQSLLPKTNDHNLSSQPTSAQIIEATKDVLSQKSYKALNCFSESNYNTAESSKPFANSINQLGPDGVELTKKGLVELHNYFQWLEALDDWYKEFIKNLSTIPSFNQTTPTTLEEIHTLKQELNTQLEQYDALQELEDSSEKLKTDNNQLTKEQLEGLLNHLERLEAQLNEVDDTHIKSSAVSLASSAVIAGLGDVAWKSSTPFVNFVIAETLLGTGLIGTPTEAAFFSGEFAAITVVLLLANLVIGPLTNSQQFEYARKMLEAERRILLQAKRRTGKNSTEIQPKSYGSLLGNDTPLDSPQRSSETTISYDSIIPPVTSKPGSSTCTQAINHCPSATPPRSSTTVVPPWSPVQTSPPFLQHKASSASTDELELVLPPASADQEYKNRIHKHYAEQLKLEQFSADESGRAIKDVWTWWMLGFESLKFLGKALWYLGKALGFTAVNTIKTVLMGTGVFYFAVAPIVTLATTLAYGNNKENDFWGNVYYEENKDTIEENLKDKNNQRINTLGLDSNKQASGPTRLETKVANYVDSISIDRGVNLLDDWFNHAMPHNLSTDVKLFAASPYFCIKHLWQKANSTNESTLQRVDKLFYALEVNNQLPTDVNDANKWLFKHELARQLRRKYASQEENNSLEKIETERHTEFDIERNRLSAQTKSKGIVHMQSIIGDTQHRSNSFVSRAFNAAMWRDTRAALKIRDKTKQNNKSLYREYKDDFLPQKHDKMVRVVVTIGMLLIPFADLINYGGLLIRTAITATFAYTTTKGCSYFGSLASAYGISFFGSNKSASNSPELEAPPCDMA